MVSSKGSSAPTALKFRLRTALVVPFVLQIVAAVGLVGYLSLRNGQQAVNRLAFQVRLEVASRTQRVMENYFTLPHQITRSNINALRLGQIKLQDKQAVERHFFYQLQTFPLSSELFMGTPDGSMIYVAHKADGSFIANTTAQFPRRELYDLDNQGRRGKLVKVTQYDARTRPWYKLALQKRGQVWTGVYIFTTLQTLGMTAAEPYYDEQGKLVAIFTAQFPLQALSDFLKTLKVSPTGQVFILDRAGSLAATSTGENSIIEVNGEKKQIKAVDSKNLLTQRTAQYLQQHFSDLSQVQQLQEVSFDIDGKRQDVLVQPYSDPKGLDFLVVVVVPEADFMEQINANTRTTIMLCLLALGLAIAVAIITANWISRPLKRIAKASRDMAGGNYDQQVASSQIIELEKLANSFNDMSWQLKNSFEKLNEVIVQANQVGLKVTSSTKQIAGAGKQLEATVTQQAVSTNEVKATATSIATISGELAKTMETIAQKATATAVAASNSQASLSEMAGAMHQLATATTLISTRLGILNENANNINSVVTTIAKVADQINLISLNAAIEAEKAGEYGAGFAVVAREVKRLADSTTVASQEIEEMVKEIQSSVSKGVKEMDKFSQQVSNHVEQVERISGQLASVIFQVQSLTPQFESVSDSMSGQFEGAVQISSAIAHLSEASQQTLASLQQTNQVLEQLNDTAQVLQRIISRKMAQ
jgi:methyl-accepting chemotaxis protein